MKNCFTDCLLPHIQHLSRHLPRETAHSSSVQLSCDGSFAAYGVTYRSCRNGRWSPDFDSHRFDCKGYFLFVEFSCFKLLKKHAFLRSGIKRNLNFYLTVYSS